MTTEDVIVAKDLAGGYPSKTVWEGADFSIGQGEFVAVLGPNGAGKTTLFRMLLGLAQPMKGSLSILGERPRRGNPRIGYVPQQHPIDSDTGIEALELVRLGLDGGHWGFGSTRTRLKNSPGAEDPLPFPSFSPGKGDFLLRRSAYPSGKDPASAAKNPGKSLRPIFETGSRQKARFSEDALRGSSGSQVNVGLKKLKNENALPALEKAMAVLRTVGAEELAHRPLGVLSGGELQRIFLAEALIGQPDLLLLDEPLANLDMRRESNFVQLINDVVRARGVTVLLIAHNINPLLPVLDRVIYVANGKITTGKPSEVLTSQSLTDLYGIPIEVLKDSRGRIAIVGMDEPMGEHHG